MREIDPLGNATSMEYDAHGHVVRQINAEGGITVFTYTDSGKLKTLTDPVGNTTSYEYDELGRLLAETNELGKTRRFEYEGRLPVRKTDRNGRVMAFEYNDFGRPIAEKWLDASGKVERTIASRYDALGKLEQVADLDSTHTFGYDELDRNTQTTMQLTGLEMPITFENQFDAANRRTQVAAKIGGVVDRVNQYAYDALGRMTSIAQGEKQVNYHYDAAGMRTATQLFSQGNEVVTTSQTYDGMGRLTQIKHGDIAQYDYSWDVANRITSMNDAEYGYDQTSQLVSAEYNKLPSEAYEYDANGNRKNFETSKNNLLTNDGEFCYIYDDEGNRIAKVSTNSKTEYFWDHRNRLVKVVDNGKSVEYDYDYQNRLVRRNDELFVHDGWQIALTLDAQGNVKNRYLWGATQDELIACDDQWMLRDHLNTIRKVVDAKGAVVSELEYNAFGVLVNATGEKPLFRYTGKMFDDATGLQWNVNRWYDAEVGRWISEDPIGFEGRDLNLNGYVGNCSTLLTDVFGKEPECIAVPNRSSQHGPPGFHQVYYHTRGIGTWYIPLRIWWHWIDYSGGWTISTSDNTVSIEVTAFSEYWYLHRRISENGIFFEDIRTLAEVKASRSGSVSCVWNKDEKKCLTSSLFAEGHVAPSAKTSITLFPASFGRKVTAAAYVRSDSAESGEESATFSIGWAAGYDVTIGFIPHITITADRTDSNSRGNDTTVKVECKCKP